MALHGVRVPRLMAGVDLTKLPLSPLEGFVLSRIDGVAPLAVLADLTNLDEEQVGRIVERLIELGAAEWVRESVSLPRATGRAATGTPTKPFSVPESLRAPPAAKLNVPRPIRPSTRPPEAPPTYQQAETPEERVDPTRRSVYPGAVPRASHTGTLHPPGELEDLELIGEADTLPPPPPPAPVADELIPEEPLLPEEPEPLAAQEEREEEELDLDDARRRRIDDLFVALDLLDHYQVLGVARGAKREDVRTAYFTLSKVFHPDTMFRKRLGSYKAKMEAIFKRLTEAYEVLGKKRAREEYDRYLELSDRTRQVEDALDPDVGATEQRELAWAAAQSEAGLAPPAPPAIAVEPIAPAPEPVAPDPTAPAPLAPEPVTSARAPSPEAQARARELMAKKLRSAVRASEAGRARGAPGEPPPEPVVVDKAVVDKAVVDKGQVLRDLASSLKSSAAHTGGLDPAHRHVLSARRAEQAGDLAEAARELRLALATAPERQDLATEHARVSALLAASLSATYEERARYEQRHGKWAAAAISWAKVFEGRPEDSRAARLAAEALVEAKGDLHRAKALAQRAAELAPDDVRGLRTLARVYQAAGLKLNARRVLERAAALDPKDEMVENLLRELSR